MSCGVSKGTKLMRATLNKYAYAFVVYATKLIDATNRIRIKMERNGRNVEANTRERTKWKLFKPFLM